MAGGIEFQWADIRNIAFSDEMFVCGFFVKRKGAKWYATQRCNVEWNRTRFSLSNVNILRKLFEMENIKIIRLLLRCCVYGFIVIKAKIVNVILSNKSRYTSIQLV